MRRWYKRLAITSILLSLLSCQEELSYRYQNPGSLITPTPGEFFTAILNNDRVRPSYWEISTFVNWHVGVYDQSVGYLNGISVYQQNESYIQNRWDDFYRPSANGAGVMANFRELEKAYLGLNGSARDDARIFYEAAKIILYDQASQMVDLWGDIPFSEAGGLNSSGSVKYPKFDSAEDVYNEIVSDLVNVSSFFATVELNQSVQAEFSKQDILMAGAVGKWRMYANSLRLRLLMRLSFLSESDVKVQIVEMLSNEAKYPLLNTTNYNPATDDILLSPLTTYSDDLHSAFTDWINYPAPYYALEQVLKPVDDPRIPVLYDKYGTTVNGTFVSNAGYNALPLTGTSIEQQENIEKYSVIDSTTFLFNAKLPGMVFTGSEIDFLRAEIYERWGGGVAAEAYINGIRNSITFYYYLNKINTTSANHEKSPSSDALDNFLSQMYSEYESADQESRLGKIYVQKWLHFGFLQSVQGWSEKRRTGYPNLTFNPSTRVGFEMPPSRLTYPDNEKTYNENYKDVAANDLRTAKIFWDVR